MTRPRVTRAHSTVRGTGWCVIYDDTELGIRRLTWVASWEAAMRRANRIARRQARPTN